MTDRGAAVSSATADVQRSSSEQQRRHLTNPSAQHGFARQSADPGGPALRVPRPSDVPCDCVAHSFARGATSARIGRDPDDIGRSVWDREVTHVDGKGRDVDRVGAEGGEGPVRPDRVGDMAVGVALVSLAPPGVVDPRGLTRGTTIDTSSSMSSLHDPQVPVSGSPAVVGTPRRQPARPTIRARRSPRAPRAGVRSWRGTRRIGFAHGYER